MAGGTAIPSQDSKRRALAGTSPKNPLRTKLRSTSSASSPFQGWVCRSRRQGSAMNGPAQSAGPPLTPLPARSGELLLDNADAVIDGFLLPRLRGGQALRE